jgi:hypothetical protein
MAISSLERLQDDIFGHLGRAEICQLIEICDSDDFHTFDRPIQICPLAT